MFCPLTTPKSVIYFFQSNERSICVGDIVIDKVQDKRAAILDATLDLISKHGFHGTPMSKVAKQAGVSAGIIYHYFENKDDLIDELYRAVKSDFGVAISAGYDEQLPLREQFRRVWINAMRYFMQHPKETVFMEQYAKSPYHRAEIEAEVLVHYLPIIQFVERARREQIIKDLPDQMLYTLTFEVISMLAQKHVDGQLEITDALIEQAVDACWDAIRR